METAALSFVRHTSKVPFGEVLNVVGIDWTLFAPGSLLFHSRCSVQCRSSHQRHLVVVEDIGLRSADVWVYYRRTIWAVPQKKLPDKLATTERTQKSASGWFQQLSHFASPRE